MNEKATGFGLGKVRLTVFQAGRPLVAQFLTDPFELIGRPDEAFEAVLKMLCEKQPVLGFNL